MAKISPEKSLAGFQIIDKSKSVSRLGILTAKSRVRKIQMRQDTEINGVGEIPLLVKDDITLLEGDTCRMHGWLEKLKSKSGFFSNWNRIFAQLEYNKLAFFSSDKQKHKGVIDFS
jgi:hypothetical protein